MTERLNNNNNPGMISSRRSFALSLSLSLLHLPYQLTKTSDLDKFISNSEAWETFRIWYSPYSYIFTSVTKLTNFPRLFGN